MPGISPTRAGGGVCATGRLARCSRPPPQGGVADGRRQAWEKVRLASPSLLVFYVVRTRVAHSRARWDLRYSSTFEVVLKFYTVL